MDGLSRSDWLGKGGEGAIAQSWLGCPHVDLFLLIGFRPPIAQYTSGESLL